MKHNKPIKEINTRPTIMAIVCRNICNHWAYLNQFSNVSPQ